MAAMEGANERRRCVGPGLAAPDVPPSRASLLNGDPVRAELLALADEYIAHPPTGTINCIAINERGDISGTTTTSGLFHKLPAALAIRR